MKKLKKIMALLLASVLTFSLAGCGASSDSDSSDQTTAEEAAQEESADSSAEKEVSSDPIRIGVLLPATGSFALIGSAAQAGCDVFEADIAGEIAGRKIEIVYEDTAGDTNTCIAKAQKLIEKEGCNIIVGPLSGGEGMAIKEFAAGYPEVTFIVAGAASEDITMRGTYPNVFRSGYTGAQTTWKLGEYVYNDLGIKKVVTCGIDNDFQYTQIAGFATSFILAGGEIVDRMWLPTDGSDYSSVITSLPEDADAIFLCAGAGQAVDFMKMFNEFGLAGKYSIIGGSTFTDTTTLSTDVGEYLEGIVSGCHYTSTADHEEYVDFNEKYKKIMGTNASLFALDYYTGLDCVKEAIESLDGAADDYLAFQEALGQVDFISVRGAVKFDEYRNIVETTYINKVERVDGVLMNVAQESYEEQTQFGPFDPDWYQEQPPADRTNPTEETIKSAKFAE